MLHSTSSPAPGVAALRTAPGRAVAATALLLPLLLTACLGRPPRPAGEPPAVELGPVIRLHEVPTSSERVRALIDDAGLAHVLASPGDRTLRHLVVDAAGAIPLVEIVRSDVKPASTVHCQTPRWRNGCSFLKREANNINTFRGLIKINMIHLLMIV